MKHQKNYETPEMEVTRFEIKKPVMDVTVPISGEFVSEVVSESLEIPSTTRSQRPPSIEG